MAEAFWVLIIVSVVTSSLMLVCLCGYLPLSSLLVISLTVSRSQPNNSVNQMLPHSTYPHTTDWQSGCSFTHFLHVQVDLKDRAGTSQNIFPFFSTAWWYTTLSDTSLTLAQYFTLQNFIVTVETKVIQIMMMSLWFSSDVHLVSLMLVCTIFRRMFYSKWEEQKKTNPHFKSV